MRLAMSFWGFSAWSMISVPSKQLFHLSKTFFKKSSPLHATLEKTSWSLELLSSISFDSRRRFHGTKSTYFDFQGKKTVLDQLWNNRDHPSVLSFRTKHESSWTLIADFSLFKTVQLGTQIQGGGGRRKRSRGLSSKIIFEILHESIGRLLRLRSLLIKNIALSPFSREPLSSLSLVAVLFDTSHSVNSKILESSIPPRALASYFSTAFNFCLIRLSISTLTVWESA